MFHNSSQRKSYRFFAVRVYLSTLPAAAASMFGLSMLFWPQGAFPPSYDFLFSQASKTIVGTIFFTLSLIAYRAVLYNRPLQWRAAHLALTILYSLLSFAFLIPGSITGTSTYGLLAGQSLLHFLDQWIPVGYSSEKSL